jgi:hypothetical protein
MQAYIISKTDFKIKHAAVLISYELNEDAATAAQSGFGFASTSNAGAGDYILLRGLYTGIICGVETDKKTSEVTLRALPVSSIFSRSILLGSAEAITENYILSAIDDNFVSSGDAFSDIPYIAAAAITQTALGITPHNDNGIYNLDTFLRYAASRYHIFSDFDITRHSLNVSVENRIPPLRIIDATVADVLTLSETVVSECVSKVTVKTSVGVTTYYLFEDGSFGTNPVAGTRMRGKTDTVYCENAADAEKSAGDVFAKNKFSHLIEAEILSESRLYDTANMRLYDRALVRTKTGVYDTYISFISRKSTAKTVLFKFGDARLTLTDKLKGGI